ncbi:MAG: alcohol dehydrogenase catalytic domain-containing protein [Planctomycetes bacterium]|nr:alcohol dehydrogenase catalytic domain-containing protein [Planctomycetota bacterium]
MAFKSVSFVADGKGNGQPREFSIPDCPADGVIMQVEMCGICGGDPYIFRGQHPHSHYPLVMGHEMIGRVAAIGKQAAAERRLAEGDRFIVEVMIPCRNCDMCLAGWYHLCRRSEQYGVSRPVEHAPGTWGAYGNYLCIDPRSITHRVSGEVPVERAVILAVLANGVRWAQLARVSIGDCVVIQGPGPQGLCSTVACKTLGADVILMGRAADRERLEMGRRLGADHVVCVEEGDPVARVRELTNARMADVALENSGAPEAVEVGLKVLRPRGRYVLSGYSGDKPVTITKDEIAKKELEVLGGWGQAGGFIPGIKIIEEGRFPLEIMVTDRFELPQAAEGISRVADGRVGMKGVVLPPKA